MAGKIVLKKAVAKPPVKARSAVKKTTDPTILCYRALRPMLVADEGKETAHERNYGDYVPEAAHWKKVGVYLKNGYIQECYINQSELDRWLEEYTERCAEEDAEKQEVAEINANLENLHRQIMEEEAKLAKGPAKAPGKLDFLQGEDTKVQEIDFGGVKMSGGGAPKPIALPRVPTREIPKTRTTTAARMKRKG